MRSVASVLCRLVAIALCVTAVATAAPAVAGDEPFKLEKLRRSGGTFYPRVVDGYLDTWDHAYIGNADHVAVLTVRNAKGVVVRTLKVRSGLYEDRAAVEWVAPISWNGRSNAGRLVPTGKYTATVVATSRSGTGSVTTGPFALTVKSGYRTYNKRVERWGDQASFSRKGKCYITAAYSSADLNCLDGGFARARYGFKVPAKATILRWRVDGGVASDDVKVGTITKKLTRPKKSRAVITITVTKKRSYRISAVSVRYRYRIPI